jgi:hypothetical protein
MISFTSSDKIVKDKVECTLGLAYPRDGLNAGTSIPMNGDNRSLVTDEPVEFQK